MLFSAAGGAITIMDNDGEGATDIPSIADSPICIRISDGSVATSQGAMGKVVTGNVFARLATEPLVFYFNFSPLFIFTLPLPGVCSLTVKWSC